MLINKSEKTYCLIDCDSFYASCEVLRNPQYAGKAVCVCRSNDIVLAASYEAKAFWVKTGTPAREAKKKLPDAIFIPPDFWRYGTVSNKLTEFLQGFTNSVEVFSIDEMFCDITWMANFYNLTQERFAYFLKLKIKKAIWIPVSIGVSNTKLLAKLFSDINKPFGHFVGIEEDEVDEVLQDHDADEVCFIWTARGARLALPNALAFKQMNYKRVKDMLWMDGLKVRMELNGYDVMKFVTNKPKNIVRTKSFHPRFTSDRNELWGHVMNNFQRAYAEMMRHELCTNHIAIHFRDKNFRRNSLDAHLSYWTAKNSLLIDTLKQLFDKCYYPGIQYRTTGVYLWNLQDPQTTTPDLFSGCSYSKDKKLADAVEQLNQKFGKTVIKSASQVMEQKQKTVEQNFVSFEVW